MESQGRAVNVKIYQGGSRTSTMFLKMLMLEGRALEPICDARRRHITSHCHLPVCFMEHIALLTEISGEASKQYISYVKTSYA